MKKVKGPYMQQAGRGNMEKTGRGIPMELKGPMAADIPGPDDPPKKKVNVRTAGVDGEPYEITVNEGSGFHSLSKELGAIPNSYRNIKGLKKSNDPFASHITPERKTFLMDSINKAELKKYQ